MIQLTNCQQSQIDDEAVADAITETIEELTGMPYNCNIISVNGGSYSDDIYINVYPANEEDQAGNEPPLILGE